MYMSCVASTSHSHFHASQLFNTTENKAKCLYLIFMQTGAPVEETRKKISLVDSKVSDKCFQLLVPHFSFLFHKFQNDNFF